MHMVMTSDETQIQMLAGWSMSHAKHVTSNNRQNPEYHVAVTIRRLRTDKNCPAENTWPNHVINEKHIGSEKTCGPPKNTLYIDAMDRKHIVVQLSFALI